MRPAFATTAVLTAGILLAGCTSTPAPSPTATATATVTPRPTPTATPTPAPTPTPASETAAPTTEPAAPAAYDLEAAYATCVQIATDDLAGMTGTFTPFDPADTNPIAEEKITTDVSADPNALMMHVHWASDTGDLETTTFCSISGPFDAPVVAFERGSSNA